MLLEVSWTIDLEHTVTPIKNFISRKEQFLPHCFPSPTITTSRGQSWFLSISQLSQFFLQVACYADIKQIKGNLWY